MRNYIVASWSDADQYDYSGEMLGGSRHKGRSQRVHFNPDGSACVASYADPEPKSKISIADRILPQQRRVTKLHAEILELEAAYKAGEFSLTDYSLLRDVAFKKKNRAEELLKRAITIPTRPNDDEYEDIACNASPHYTEEMYAEERDQGLGDAEGLPVWIRELRDENSLKNMLIRGCKVVRTAVRWHQKARNYYQTLKAL